MYPNNCRVEITERSFIFQIPISLNHHGECKYISLEFSLLQGAHTSWIATIKAGSQRGLPTSTQPTSTLRKPVDPAKCFGNQDQGCLD